MDELMREMIESEPAGRQMDAWVAEYVMGLPFVHKYSGEWLHTRDPIPFVGAPIIEYYSTDIAAAWQVVEKMNKRYQFDLGSNVWSVSFVHGMPGLPDFVESYVEFESIDEVPLMICRAALLATLAPSPGGANA
jgi:hypothetical protein